MQNTLPILDAVLGPVSVPIFTEGIEQISDENLYSLCEQYGYQARTWRDKFIGLLGEVYKRRLYEKKWFFSIYEFAAKLAGVSEAQMDTVLRAERKLEGKPILANSFHKGELSINKLIKVLPIATSENEAEVDILAKAFSVRTLEVYVRDQKRAAAAATMEVENLPTLFSVAKSLHVQKFKLSDDVIEELNHLAEQDKDINELLREFLNQKKQEIERKEQELSTRSREETHVPSRTYYKKAIRDFLREKYGEKCAIHGCTKPAEEIHHKIRFGLQANNDPAYLVPLCKDHHKIAHAIDLAVVRHWKK
ncbi:MAG: HNH endonuclease signature motif containing protein [Candidatus Gracilibacteria bacterium]|jgi:hypothetical protein